MTNRKRDWKSGLKCLSFGDKDWKATINPHRYWEYASWVPMVVLTGTADMPHGTLNRYITLVLVTFLTGTEDSLHKLLTFKIVWYKSHNIELKTSCTLYFYP